MANTVEEREGQRRQKVVIEEMDNEEIDKEEVNKEEINKELVAMDKLLVEADHHAGGCKEMHKRIQPMWGPAAPGHPRSC